jgi:microcin C transport system permease protein
MLAYIIRRLLLVIPTLFGIMLINFAVIQFAPGGPVEQLIAKLQGNAVGATARFGGGTGSEIGGGGRQSGATAGAAEGGGRYRGAQGLDPEFIKQIEKMYGFDMPPV